ncbi:hypothetical protein, partial [Facilibium subflavum]|uniref:hypothetical protein n=1 Tax=Facilibium subflavum TaxID=2219058 RepID=UPI001AAD3B85
LNLVPLTYTHHKPLWVSNVLAWIPAKALLFGNDGTENIFVYHLIRHSRLAAVHARFVPQQ